MCALALLFKKIWFLRGKEDSITLSYGIVLLGPPNQDIRRGEHFERTTTATHTLVSCQFLYYWRVFKYVHIRIDSFLGNFGFLVGYAYLRSV